MDKIAKLGWTSGLILRPLGQRIGVRTNTPHGLDLLLEMARKQGWDWEQTDEPVPLLYSLRLAPPSERRGRRDFNLLYLFAGRLTRTLDQDEIMREFVDSVWAVAALACDSVVLLRGRVFTENNKTVLAAGAPLDPTLPVTETAGNGLVALDNEGLLVSEAPSRKIDILELPEASEEKISPGAAVLKLLAASITPYARSLPILSRLAGCALIRGPEPIESMRK